MKLMLRLLSLPCLLLTEDGEGSAPLLQPRETTTGGTLPTNKGTEYILPSTSLRFIIRGGSCDPSFKRLAS